MAASPPQIVAAADRDSSRVRDVAVAVPDRPISATSEVGRIAAAPGGSLLGALLIMGEENDRRRQLINAAQKRAEANAAPVRDALTSIDLGSLAMTTTEQALAETSWLTPGTIRRLDKGTDEAIASFAADASSDQIALIRYRYELSPDCSQIRIIADVQLMPASNSAAPLYEASVAAITELQMRTFEPSENGVRWGDEGGWRARYAVEDGFRRLAVLIPRLLDLSESDLARYRRKSEPKAFGAGFNGTLIVRSDDQLLIWADGLVSIGRVPATAP